MHKETNTWKQVVIGVDAAWTSSQPSGVSLLGFNGHQWCCISVAPGYQQFIDTANGGSFDWNARITAGLPDISSLLEATQNITNRQMIDVIAVDMPLSTVPVTSRRVADNKISREYGKMGCAVHSPTADRPGVIADNLRSECQSAGFILSTDNYPAHESPALIEVYPHTAILKLLGIDFRHPYKVSKSGKYWPGTSVEERKTKLICSLNDVLNALKKEISDIELVLPPINKVPTLNFLKRYEDAIDSLVCSWVATRYLQRQCTSYGDDEAAIWTPTW